MPKSSSKSTESAPSFRAKTVIVFSLEDVLIPGKAVPDVDVKKSLKLLKDFRAYQKKHPEVKSYLISGLTHAACEKKMKEFGLDGFFAKENVFGVTKAYLDQMQPVDREIYEKKCADDEFCLDEYFRQVQMQSLMRTVGHVSSQMLLIGHDYWFDGFYTRRFAKVDVVFIESALTSRSAPIKEKIQGVWYSPLSWKGILPFVEGKAALPNYSPLDTWVSVTLTEELLGAKGFGQVKRVIIERKKPNFPSDSTKLS